MPLIRVTNAFVAFTLWIAPSIAFADCPSLNFRKPNELALSLMKRSILLFLGTIERTRFVGDFSQINNVDAPQPVEITYKVETLYKGKSGTTITLRTPFSPDDGRISNKGELKEALDSLPRRALVYVADKIDTEGHRIHLVSGFCPPSINPISPEELKLIAALNTMTKPFVGRGAPRTR